MTEWREVMLNELGSVERGRSRHRPRNDPQLFGGDMPFFQTGDVKAATLHMTTASQYYSEFGIAQSRVWSPGIACITIAANIADTAILGCEGCFPDSVLGFTPTYQQSDAYFVKYLLDVHRSQLASAARGTTQDNLSLEKLLSFHFRVPEAASRVRICEILHSLDDLIETNRRRIEVLEGMARAIYREWFVSFRYPGHEDVPLVDSPLGSIPEGWVLASASEVLTINPRLSVDRGSARPFVSMGDVNAHSMICFSSEVRSDSSGSKFQNGDTLFARITPCLENGKTAYVQSLALGETGRGSTEFIVLRGKRVGPVYTYMLAREDEFRAHAIKSMSGASGRQRVRNECFNSYLVAAPSASLARKFEQVAEPVISMAYSLACECRAVAKLRDLLLPKLVTGRIDVSNIDLDGLMDSVA